MAADCQTTRRSDYQTARRCKKEVECIERESERERGELLFACCVRDVDRSPTHGRVQCAVNASTSQFQFQLQFQFPIPTRQKSVANVNASRDSHPRLKFHIYFPVQFVLLLFLMVSGCYCYGVCVCVCWTKDVPGWAQLIGLPVRQVT